MTEAIFPFFGVAVVLLLALPAFALLAKGGLMLMERQGVASRFRLLNAQFLLLTGSSVLPLAWFFSAGLHQAESSQSALACIVGHDDAELCLEAAFFALNLGLLVLGRSWSTLHAVRPVARSSSQLARTMAARVDELLAASQALSPLKGKVIVTDDAGATIGVQGWVTPLVFVGVDFASRLSDEMLASALAHENEHLRARDPLRYLLLQLALVVNPVGRFLLEPHVVRWFAVREAQCDREAVLGGSSPLSLADAIILAARPTPARVPALGPPDTAVLKFRVELLLAFSEQRPDLGSARTTSTLPMALALLSVALLLPHQAGTVPLDLLHTTTEHALSLAWR